MLNTRLCLFDGVHNEMIERTCRCRDSNVVLLWNGSEISKATLDGMLGPWISRTNGTYMESVDATGALQLGETVQHPVLGSVGCLRSPGFLYFLSASGCLLSALL